MARSVKRLGSTLSIVGFDLGTSFGFSWLQIENLKARVVESGTWNLSPNKDMNEGTGVRFQMGEQYVKYFLKLAKPDIVVYEGVARHDGTLAAHMYGGFEALVIMVAEQENIPYFFYYPLTIKKSVTGYGKASKEEVAEALEGFFPGIIFRTTDQSDAVAIAVTGARKQGWLELG